MYYYVYMLISKGNKPVSYVGYTNNLKKESSFITQEKVQNLQEVENGN